MSDRMPPSQLVSSLRSLLSEHESARRRIARMLADPDVPEDSIRLASGELWGRTARLQEVRSELEQIGVTF